MAESEKKRKNSPGATTSSKFKNASMSRTRIKNAKRKARAEHKQEKKIDEKGSDEHSETPEAV